MNDEDDRAGLCGYVQFDDYTHTHREEEGEREKDPEKSPAR